MKRTLQGEASDMILRTAGRQPSMDITVDVNQLFLPSIFYSDSRGLFLPMFLAKQALIEKPQNKMSSSNQKRIKGSIQL